VVSNQASATSNVEVMTADRHSQLQRPISAAPVAVSPAASRASSPAHAVDQCAALMVDGSEQARMRTHGTMARPAISTPRPSQLFAGGGVLFRAVTGRRGLARRSPLQGRLRHRGRRPRCRQTHRHPRRLRAGQRRAASDLGGVACRPGQPEDPAGDGVVLAHFVKQSPRPHASRRTLRARYAACEHLWGSTVPPIGTQRTLDLGRQGTRQPGAPMCWMTPVIWGRPCLRRT
jgi:hypothetical protein